MMTKPRRTRPQHMQKAIGSTRRLPHMGHVLQQLLREKSVTQGQCAVMVGMTRQQVSYLCRSRRWQAKTIERVCGGLNAPLGLFFGAGV